FVSIYALFTILYTAAAMLPETSPDGVCYHLGLVSRYLREHGFPRITTSLVATFPEGVEMLFLFAFAFGKHTAAGMVHWLFLLAAPIGILSCARRMGSPVAGVTGALIFYLTPVVGKAGTIAYVDIALACSTFGVFYLLVIWKDQRSDGLLAAAGLLAGFAYAAKYTGVVALVFAMSFVALYTWRTPKRAIRALFITALCALPMIAPWMAKNAVVVGNPFSPFATRLFPNPYFYLSSELAFTMVTSTVGGVAMKEFPMEAAIHGGRLQGLLGPAFLLAPLILLGLRSPFGRQLLAAAAIVGLPNLLNHGTRFLIPALPFVSLLLGWILARWSAAAALLVAMHALLAWPAIIPRYADQGVWALDRMDWKTALRLRSEPDYLRRKIDDYSIGLSIDKLVPPGEAIFSFHGMQEAYHTHPVIVDWQSAQGLRAGRAMRAALSETLRAGWIHEYRFPQTTTRTLRLLQTHESGTDNWTVAEVRLLRQGVEVPRAPGWRLRASPNPWEVQLAFDNSPVTSWNSGRAHSPGMFIEIDFGREESIDQVVVECTRDQLDMRMSLDLGGVSIAEAALRDAPPQPRLRRAAIDFLKQNGWRWMVIHDSDQGARDFSARSKQWGIAAVASDRGFTLYRLD
ncbi:MAG: glycosyltransferase family 39 protein, partial [Bryobacteraceae bacterium]